MYVYKLENVDSDGKMVLLTVEAFEEKEKVIKLVYKLHTHQLLKFIDRNANKVCSYL